MRRAGSTSIGLGSTPSQVAKKEVHLDIGNCPSVWSAHIEMLISVQKAAGEDGGIVFACMHRCVDETKDNLVSVRSRAVSELSH